jgi:hypothetical protein
MFRSLRKGRSSVYLQYEITGHTIGAEKFESEIADGVAVLGLCLRPVDENQRNDEKYLETNALLSISISDAMVVNGFSTHVNAHMGKVESWELSVVSQGRAYTFHVQPSLESHGALQVLHFQVGAAAP